MLRVIRDADNGTTRHVGSGQRIKCKYSSK
jgi:hypothetical protein